MAQLIRKTYEVDGHHFTLKPTTIRNRNLLKEYFDERRKRAEARRALLENPPALEDGETVDIPEPDDDYKMYFDFFCMLTEGPHEKLSVEDFDIKLGEAVLADFLPTATRTVMLQTGFLTPQML